MTEKVYMRHPWKLPMAVVCLLALTFLPLLPAPRGSAQAVNYTATDVGTLGGAQSTALGLDECGKVVGESNPTGSGFLHPYFWDGATMTDIGTFGGQSGGASAVNSGGRVVGFAQTATSEQRPFVWTQAAGRTDLGVAGTGAAAYDINDSNRVVGQWETSPLQDRAFVWTQATGMQIVTAPWGTPIAAYGINNAGHIVGTAQTSAGASHAFLSSGGVVTDLGTLGGTNSFAYDLNESGVVVGHANIPSSNASRPFHAFRWTSAGGIQDLGTLGGVRSIAYGVNASGRIVGYAEVSSGVNHAFLWADDNANGAHDAGEMKDLNTLAPNAGWTYEEARALNDRGQIVVTAVNGSGQRRAFLLTPDNVGPSPCAVPGALQFSAATEVVGEAGTNATVTVTRAGGSDEAVSVGYATSNGTATAGADYTATSGTLNFADGETSKSFNVAVSDDTLDEADETVNLTLSGPAGGATLGTQSTAVLNITDNDSAPTISVADPAAVPEGNAGTVNLVFSVTLAAASAQTVTVGYATSSLGMTATAGTDYTAASGTLTFNPGDTLQTVTVAVTGDTLDEPNETFFLNLSAPSNATFADGQAVGTINDDDGASSLSIGDVTVTEGDAGLTAATFTVTLLPASGQQVNVKYVTADGTANGAVANPSSDYISMANDNNLSFGPGETSKTITVNVRGDIVGEAHETFFVNLSNPTNATISDAQGQATVNNDDTALSINDLTLAEGNASATAFNFTVTLSHASANTVSVHYDTSDGTAAQPGDYTAASGTLTFAPGDTSETVTINATGETTFETSETFNVTLSSATGGATISDNTGVGTITNDDTAPAFSINDVTVNEGNSLTTEFNFNVTLSAASGLASSVSYATAPGTPAPDSADYTAASGTLNFAPGETLKTVKVLVNGDTNFENTEIFFVNLSGASGATISDNQGQGTITNDEASSTFQFSVENYVVGEAGTSATVTVTRSPATAGGATVHYATSNGSALANSDFTAINGTLTFPAGVATQTFNVSVVNDALDEPDETVSLALSAPFGGTVGARSVATLTITDDDPTPTFSVSDVAVAEGNTGTTVNATFTVTLSAPSGVATSVNYATAAGGTATAGSDYTAASGTLNFAAGDTSKTFNVSVNGDRLFENNETFFVSLSNPTGATVNDGQGVGTINNDEETSVVQFSPPLAGFAAGEAGTAAVITVTRTGTAGGVTVNVITEGGTAVDTQNGPDDYQTTSVILTFGEGETSKTFNVPVVNDTLDEPDEEFFVKLNPSFSLFGATFGTPNTATVTIVDNDDPPAFQFSAATYSVSENNSDAVIILKRTGGTNGSPFSGPVSVRLTTSDGTAVAGSDYTATSITVSFSEGSGESGPIFIPINRDTLDEADETVNLTLGDPVGGVLGSPITAVLTIVDNDGGPSLSVEDVAFPEGDTGVFVVPFVVTLSAASGQTVTVNYAAADGTAAVGSDYAASSGTLTFAPGETTKTIGVQVGGDMTNEADETFFVNLSGATNATISDAQGVGTIQNDDAPTLDFLELSFPAAESSHFVTVTVFRSGDTASPVNVDFTTSDGTATERKDYTAVSGTLRFAAGENTKTFDVLLTEDAFTEPVETINLTLSNPTGGATLGTQPEAVVLLAADDNPPPAGNPIDNSSDFVRQHYHDFLNREPDADGLAFWVSGIESCGSDAACREAKRINTSAAFFLSIEFQETGYFAYRAYKAAYGDATSLGVEGTVPAVRLNEFLPDTRRIGEGVVVGPAGWDLKLEANKNAYMLEFVSRQRFTDAYPATMTPAAFVDALYTNAGVTPSAAERQAAIGEFGAAATSADAPARARALRRVAEHAALVQAELRRAFVLMQYYGYLRRNPDDAPEPGLNFGGWNFWLGKLNEFNGDPVRAEMVKAFLDSAEYRNRFGN
jgi:probable HAF family extracellular repeat protein